MRLFKKIAPRRNRLPACIDSLESRRLFAAGFSVSVLASSAASDHAEFTDADLSTPVGIADVEESAQLTSNPGFGFLRTANQGSNTSTLIPLSTTAGTHTIDVKISSPTGVALNQNDEPVVHESIKDINGVPAEVVYTTAGGNILGTGTISNVTYSGQVLETGAAHSKVTGLTGFFADPTFGIRGFDFAAADFGRRVVKLVETSGPGGNLTLSDATAAHDLSPFNVADANPDTSTPGQLLVAYVEKNSSGHAMASDTSYVAIIDSGTGNVIRRITWAGSSRLPYGMVRLGSGFGKFSDDIVIADHASGYLRAYTASGKYAGLLMSKTGKSIKLPGVWSIVSPSASGHDGTLYFTQSPTATIGRVGVLKYA